MARIRQCSVVFISTCLVICFGAIQLRQQTMSMTGEKMYEQCHPNKPCGWGGYVPFRRTPEFWLRNDCDCHGITHCSKFVDDVPASMFIYYCANLTDSRVIRVDNYSQIPWEIPLWIGHGRSSGWLTQLQ